MMRSPTHSYFLRLRGRPFDSEGGGVAHLSQLIISFSIFAEKFIFSYTKARIFLTRNKILFKQKKKNNNKQKQGGGGSECRFSRGWTGFFYSFPDYRYVHCL